MSRGRRFILLRKQAPNCNDILQVHGPFGGVGWRNKLVYKMTEMLDSLVKEGT